MKFLLKKRPLISRVWRYSGVKKESSRLRPVELTGVEAYMW